MDCPKRCPNSVFSITNKRIENYLASKTMIIKSEVANISIKVHLIIKINYSELKKKQDKHVMQICVLFRDMFCFM